MLDQCLETISGEPNLVIERLRSHLRRPTVGSVYDFGVAIAHVFQLHSTRYNLSKLHLPPCWHHSWINQANHSISSIIVLFLLALGRITLDQQPVILNQPTTITEK